MKWFRNSALVPSATLALIMLWPMFDAHEQMPTGDAVAMVWNQWHTTERILEGRNPLYTEVWLWPDGASLAKHTLSPGFAPVALAVRAVTDSPLWPFYALRAIIFGSFVLLWTFSYYLLRICGSARWASAAIASCFTYSHFFLLEAHYPQFASMWFYPLCSILLVLYYRAPSLGRLVALGVSVAASVYFTEMVVFWCLGVVISSVCCIATTPGRAVLWRSLNQSRWYWWPVSVAGSLVVAIPFLVHYARTDVISLLHTASEYSASPGTLLMWLGVVIPAAAIFYYARTRAWWPLLASSAILLILSLGPDLTIGGTTYEDVLPYIDLTWVPTFNDFRAPARLTVVALFFLSVPAALGLSRIRRRAGIAIVLAITAFECLTPRDYASANTSDVMALRNVFALPPASFVDLIQRQPDGVWATYPPLFYDTAGVYAQIFHHQPIFGGCWLSRCKPGASRNWQEYLALYHAGDMEAVGDWLRAHGVQNVLLIAGDAWTTPGLNVVDVRGMDFDPFR